MGQQENKSFGLWERVSKNGKGYYSGSFELDGEKCYFNLWEKASTNPKAPVANFTINKGNFRSEFLPLWKNDEGDGKGTTVIEGVDYKFTASRNRNKKQENSPEYYVSIEKLNKKIDNRDRGDYSDLNVKRESKSYGKPSPTQQELIQHTPRESYNDDDLPF